MERVHKTHVMLRKRVRVALFRTRKGVEEKLYPEPACHANLIEVYSFLFWRKEPRFSFLLDMFSFFP